MDINLVRDKQTGKSRGYAFIAYEDQRSTVLAVDNLNGAKVLFDIDAQELAAYNLIFANSFLTVASVLTMSRVTSTKKEKMTTRNGN